MNDCIYNFSALIGQNPAGLSKVLLAEDAHAEKIKGIGCHIT